MVRKPAAGSKSQVFPVGGENNRGFPHSAACIASPISTMNSMLGTPDQNSLPNFPGCKSKHQNRSRTKTMRSQHPLYRIILKSKIHRAILTGKKLDYEGSIAVDLRLMQACGPYRRRASSCA